MLGFSFSHCDSVRRSDLTKMFSKTGVCEIAFAALLLPFSVYFAALFCLSGVVFASMAGGVRVSDYVLKKREQARYRNAFPSPKLFIRPTCSCAHNHTRSHRSASRPSFSRSSKKDSDSGESDSGDPPGPLPLVTPPLYGNRNTHNFSLTGQGSGCWRVVSTPDGRRCFA